MEKISENLLNIIKNGECYTTEFKEATVSLPKSLFETICGMLNRNGGHIFLGIKDNCEIVGVNKASIEKMKKDFINLCNNPQKIFPTIYVRIHEYEYNGKIILHIYIPQSSTVHRTGGKVFDRNQDGDYEITNESLVESIYLRKQIDYSENRIYPFATMDDLRIDVIERVKRMAIENYHLNGKGQHPWINLTPQEILKSLQLYDKDYTTGKEGLTLAAILLFGKDKTILSIVPHHRTDALYRVHDTDRYDDRDIITTNLIESYDRLMAFIVKHLDDRFYLENDRRIDIRNIIGREICVNLLIHREFVEPFYSRLIIEKDVLRTENANKARMIGDILQEKDFSPKPKNPKIAMVFRQIGLADELGSGMIKLLKYTKAYSNGIPKLIEGDIFRTEIPLVRVENMTIPTTLTTTLTETQQRIINLIKEDNKITRDEMASKIGITKYGIQYNLNILKKKKYIRRIGKTYKGYWEVLHK